jgi:membrane associated rhomboid family serine protease
MYSVTDVVKNIIILNVLVFITVHYFMPYPEWRIYFELWHPKYEEGIHGVFFHPVQFVTSMFNHADIRHLLFNMFGLYFLGPYVERVLGPQRFLLLYFSSGIVGSVAQMLIDEGGSVGASGAIYGVLIAFATMFPSLRLNLFLIPGYFPAKYIAIGLILIGLFSGFTGFNNNIGHFAHIGGAVCGFLLIQFWGLAKLRD